MAKADDACRSLSRIMVEEIVNAVTIKVGSYSDHPLPQALEEAWIFQAFVDGAVDRDHLVSELRTTLEPNPFCLDDSMKRTSWGAEGSVLEIFVQVAQFMGGAGGAVAAVDRLIERLQRKNASRGTVTSDMASANARRQLADFLQRSEEDVTVEALDRTRKGFRLVLRSDNDLFEAEVDEKETYHLKRISRSKDSSESHRSGYLPGKLKHLFRVRRPD